MDVVERVLSFWYDVEFLDLAADGDHRMAWFKKDDAFDQAIRDQFEADVTAAANGEYDEWPETGGYDGGCWPETDWREAGNYNSEASPDKLAALGQMTLHLCGVWGHNQNECANN